MEWHEVTVTKTSPDAADEMQKKYQAVIIIVSGRILTTVAVTNGDTT